MTTEGTWPLVQEGLRAFAPHYGPAMQAVIEEANVNDAEWFLLYAAFGSEEGKLTDERVNTLFPYLAPTLQAELLVGLVAKDRLSAGSAAGEYQLTDSGHAVVAESFDAARAALGEIAVMPADQMECLADLLKRVVDASVEATEPANTPNISISRHADPGDDAPAPARIDQYVTDISAFRDDAHCAAWRTREIDGYAWEAFTFVWRGDASNAETLGETLDFRGYDSAAYARALNELERRGWVVPNGDGYQITEMGRTVRDDAEAATDRYFYAPWTCLSETEHDELHAGLRQLCDRLVENSDSD